MSYRFSITKFPTADKRNVEYSRFFFLFPELFCMLLRCCLKHRKNFVEIYEKNHYPCESF